MQQTTIARMMKVRDRSGRGRDCGWAAEGSVLICLDLKLRTAIVNQGSVACQIQI
jgi:hypothetical protein